MKRTRKMKEMHSGEEKRLAADRWKPHHMLLSFKPRMTSSPNWAQKLVTMTSFSGHIIVWCLDIICPENYSQDTIFYQFSSVCSHHSWCPAFFIVGKAYCTNLIKLQGHFDKMFGNIVSPPDQDVVGIDNFPFLSRNQFYHRIWKSYKKVSLLARLFFGKWDIFGCIFRQCVISLQSWGFSLHDRLHSWCPAACFVIGFLNATWLSWSDFLGVSSQL